MDANDNGRDEGLELGLQKSAEAEGEGMMVEDEVAEWADPSGTSPEEAPEVEGKEQQEEEDGWDWTSDLANPWNWPAGKKARQVFMIAAAAMTASVGISIISPAVEAIVVDFDVTPTEAILPVSLYVFALALGPIVGGPLSETVGRFPVYAGCVTLGGLFTLGAGFSRTFAGLCVLRFLAGFCFGPVLAIASGSLNEMFIPARRALPSTIVILCPFLGPGLGPVIGGFAVSNKGWRWTQWCLLFFVLVTVLALIFSRETYGPVIKARRAREPGLPPPPSKPLSRRLRDFATAALIRPVHMLLTEPIVTFTSLYVSCEFATLFSFFAAFPYVFKTVYGFGVEESGLVFLSIVVGCLLGTVTILLCDVFGYRPNVARYPPHRVPPEYRLYPAMIGGFLLPLGLFWFGWTARAGVHWASPVVAIIPFACGNICLFISCTQYIVDAYHSNVIASATSSNTLSRYLLAGAFPLFTRQMYQNLGIGWATSVYGFIAIALMPVPWLIFIYGKKIRAKSRYPTSTA